MAHAKYKTVPLPSSTSRGRRGREQSPLPYQITLKNHFRVDRVKSSHTETLVMKCGRCGDKTPISGFAPVFEEDSGFYHGRPVTRRVLLCWDCYMNY